MESFTQFMSGFTSIEPLSNFQIEEKCKKLKIKNFTGVFMRDELKRNKKCDSECMIINIDHSNNNGTHWTCLYKENGSSFYFDSFGLPPTLEVKDYLSNEKYRYYNSFEIQKFSEVICGHYCIYVLYKLSNGMLFENILDELYRYHNKT